MHDPAPRSTSSAATGGQVESAKWFRGDAVLFGGLAFQATDKLTLRAGYPSDADLRETSPGLFENKSPFNFGPNYQLRENIHMQAHYLYGSELGISFNLSTNPRKPTVDGGAGQAPLPVKRRTSAGGLGWVSNLETKKFVRNQTASFLSADGMTLEDRSA